MTSILEWLQFVLAPQSINGLSIGVAVVLMALGLTIIFGLLDVINMAHGECYALGAYAVVVILGMGVSFWWALLLTSPHGSHGLCNGTWTHPTGVS